MGVARAADTAMADVPAVLTACGMVGIASTIRWVSGFGSTVGCTGVSGAGAAGCSFLGSLTGGGVAAGGGSAGLGLAGLTG